MNLKNILAATWLLFVSLHASAQTVLSIPDVSVSPGMSIELPIKLTNTADVVAVQFLLTMPDGITLDVSTVALSERADGHSVVLQQKSDSTYLAMVYSATNNALIARTGTLLTITLWADESLVTGDTLCMGLSDVAIAAADGSNLDTGSSAGLIIIDSGSDLAVSNVSTDATSLTPGDTIIINWMVENVGAKSTEDGWQEQLFLDDTDGSYKLLGTVYYDGTLASGAVVSRSAQIVLPSVLRIDSVATLRVKLVPNSGCGEPSWSLANNEASIEEALPVNLQLTLTPAIATLEETLSPRQRFYLARSGSTSSAETFELSATTDARLSLPESVTIAAGASGAYFYATCTANGVLDNDSIVSFSLSGNNYSAVSATIYIEDDTYPSLTLEADAENLDVNEGESFNLTITTERAPSTDIEVKVTCDLASRFSIPSSIILPAGETSVSTTIEAVDDDTPDVEQVVTFKVSAAKHNAAALTISLIDDDVPSLQLTLEPSAVSEGAGPLAVYATLTRTDNTDKSVTIKLSDDSDGDIYYGKSSFTMAAGVEEVIVNLGPIDNSTVDGERTVDISAAVWISSCSCSASSGTSGGVVTVPLTIYDDDGPTLNLAASSSVLSEGGEMNVTLSRNTDTTEALTVSIVGSDDDALSYPETVIIPAGASSTTFTLTSAANGETGDSFTATLTASATDFSSSTLWFTVSDQTLPDAQISAISVSESEVYTGDTVTIYLTLVNTGSYELAEQTKVCLYKSGSSTAIATTYLQTSLAAGDSIVLSRQVAMPTTIGTYSYYAVANDGKGTKELSYTNNTSATISVSVQSPYSSYSVQTDKDIYEQGDSVYITGQVGGRSVAGAEVEVYVVNNSSRQSMSVTTDDTGNFSTAYAPYSGQIGHFDVGACYPGEASKESMAVFNILGLQRTSSSYIKCNLTVDEPYTGSFTIKNPSDIDLTGVQVSLTTQSDDCDVAISLSETIGAGSTAKVGYTLTSTAASTGDSWIPLYLQITSDQAPTLAVTIYYYATSAEPNLKSLTSSIKTTLTIGTDKEYPFYITNTGQGETGTITVSLPDWMTCATPSTMSSLAYGDTAQVVLRLSSNDNMTANVNVTGKIAINCANGDGITIPYTVTPVSESTGVLRVDVCDEYTYYTTEAPHVEGATVTVTNTATSTVVATGTTDSDGIFEAEIPAGYYKLTVKADSHSSYSNNILVDAGTTTTKTIDLSIQAITITYDIVETEVEDQYTIVTTVTYETNVPVPVVVIDGPESVDIDAMAEGESQVLLFTLTNQGLIKAEDVEFILPDNTDEYSLTPLVSTGPYEELAAQSSIIIPVLFAKTATSEDTSVSRRKASTASSSMKSCMAGFEAQYKYVCGTDLKDNETLYKMAIRTCALSTIVQTVASYYSGGSGSSSGGSGGALGSPTGSGTSTTTTDSDYGTTVYNQDRSLCNSDLVDALSGVLSDCLVGNIPGLGSLLGDYSTIMKFLEKRIENGGKVTPESVRDLLRSLIWSRIPYSNVWDCSNSVAKLVVELHRLMLSSNTLAGNAGVKARLAAAAASSTYGWASEFSEVGNAYLAEIESALAIYAEVFGDEVWYSNPTDISISEFFDYCATIDTLTIETLSPVKPECVSTAQLEAFVERMNNWSDGVTSGNTVDNDTLLANAQVMSDAEEAAIATGYESMTAWFDEAYAAYIDALDEESSSVCATVTLQLSQSMVMTRQAFRGTLTIYNGHESEAMTDVLLNLTITDPDGNIATSHEFEVTAESLDTFEGELDLTSGWNLAAGATGTATVLYIPTKYAAPTESIEYTFGGSISYVDPFTGLVVTYDITDITLTVKPSPNLDLTYFMQRDILGDDALTTDVVEPSVEAEFSLLINNVGYGDATNVTMVTNQPSIIDNEKGLAITFELVSSQLNGGEKSLALGSSVTNNFGTIAAQQTAYAQWWITSSLTGHFTDYDVEATHVTSYDNPDLTLLNEVTIHELIRSLEVVDGSETMVAFLTNDIEDANDTPDMLYLGDGTTASVSTAASVFISQISDMVYELSVTPSETGWNYGSISDPTYGMAELVGIVRNSDGQSLSLRNFWQTDRTLRDGKDPLYENRIHFADEFASTSAETYTLTFEPLPDVVLAVQSIDGVPDTLATSHVESLSVTFNKTIDPETFTDEDLTCTVQGKKQDTSLISISTEDNQTFTLDLIALNDSTGNGYYTLSVQTAAITDSEGYTGSVGKTVGWTMFEGGFVQLLTDVQPAAAGTIERVSADGETVTAPRRVSATDDVTEDVSNVDYGTTIYLKAVPETGYNFIYWTVNGEVVSYDALLEQDAVDDLDVVANFVLKTYPITVEYDETLGSVGGAYTGVYTHGDTLTFVATPIEDYVLAGWLIDGEDDGEDDTLTLVVSAATTVSATFTRDIYYQKLIATKGWTWVSSYLQEGWLVSGISSNVSRLLSQTDELYSDPTYGLVGGINAINAAEGYKLYASTSFVKTFSGHLYDAAESPIALSAGWNWIGYPHNETLDIAEALTNAEEGDYLVAQDGFTGYEDGSWEGTITEFTPSAGYLYKSTSAKTLAFDLTGNSTGTSSISRRLAAKVPSVTIVDMHDYPATMNIITCICTDGEEIDGTYYNVYAVAGDECRGVSSYVGSHHYLTIYGEEAEEISFIVEDSRTGGEYLADETLTFVQDVVGSRNAPYQLTIGETTGINVLDSDNHALRVYTLTGILVCAEAGIDTIKQLPSGVYIIDGRKYIVK